MGLIVITPTPTTVQSEAALLSSVTQQLNSLYTLMFSMWSSLHTSLWNNPDGSSPQAVMNTFGTSAGSYITAMNSLQTDIQAAVPAQAFPANPPGQIATINADGTVTIS